jgi:hypothetical protein
MKNTIGFLLLIHGIIHLKGFVDAFFTTTINQQVLGISKPVGSLWLVTFIIFIASAVQYFSNKNWFYIALIALFFSQLLIIMTWTEAKYGTLFNVIILLASITAYGNYKFNRNVERETNNLLKQVSHLNQKLLIENDLKSLPEIVQKWLHNSNVIKQETIFSVKLKQIGEMRTKPDGNWMPFKATQYFNCINPSFIWSTNVETMPLISIIGRDKFIDGKGEMQIKLASLISVVNEKPNDKINQGAMVRYLAEICWFPSVAINKYISWKSINETSAKATLRYNNQSVSGVFSFNANGDFVSFIADRYYGGKSDSTLHKWYVEALSYKEFKGIRIPNKSKVTWKLPEGDFNWLNVEITDIEFNPSKRY